MTSFDYSAVVIVPLALREKANRLTCALGYDQLPGHTFSIGMRNVATGPITHYGCRTWAKQQFIDIISGAGEGSLPDDIDWEAFGLTPEDVAKIVRDKIHDVRPAGEYANHLEDVAAQEGFEIVLQD